MLKAVFRILRFILLIFAGHKEIALENAALRQQLAILKRDRPRPTLHRRDRLFWVLLMKMWTKWKSALVIVQPATVVNWQRRRFKLFTIPSNNSYRGKNSPTKRRSPGNSTAPTF